MACHSTSREVNPDSSYQLTGQDGSPSKHPLGRLSEFSALLTSEKHLLFGGKKNLREKRDMRTLIFFH